MRKVCVPKDVLEDFLKADLSAEEMCQKLDISSPCLRKQLKKHELYDQFKVQANQRIKKICALPENKAKLAASKKESFAKPEYRQHMSQKVKEAWSDPELLARQSVIAKNNWKKEDYREKVVEKAAEAVRRPEHRESVSKTMQDLWGTSEHRQKMLGIMARSEVKAKVLEARSSPEYKRKMSETKKRVWENPEFQKKMALVVNSDSYKAKQVAAQKEVWSNIDYREKQAKVRQNQKRSFTKPHLKVMALLDTLGFAYKPEHPVGPYNFDLFVPANNLLIEVQGDYWHSLSKAQRNDKSKTSYIANLKEYTLKHIWEHELLTEGSALAKLKYWLGAEVQKKDFNKKDLAIIQPEVKEADKFLYDFHYQHAGKHGVDFAGYLDGQIVVLARFAAPTRKEIATSMGYEFKQVLELTRLCVHPVYQQKNLLSWFLARCEGQIKKDLPEVKCLVSFADKTYNHTGVVYRAANWKLEHVVEPNYWYVNSDGWVMHKKTLWNQSRSLKMSENEFAEQKGYTKVWGMEKYKFSRNLQEQN